MSNEFTRPADLRQWHHKSVQAFESLQEFYMDREEGSQFNL